MTDNIVLRHEKLTLSQLKIGMQVRIIQLSQIYNTHIILTDIKDTPNGDRIGTISYIGESLSEDISQLFESNNSICSIYKTQ